MIRRLTLLLWLLPGIALAQNERAPEIPELDIEIVTGSGAGAPVYVQQQVLLKITLTSRHPFKTLQIETPAIRDSESHVASRARTREFSTYGGSGWRHQRITALFPLRSGPWELPAITATGSVVRPDGTTAGFESVWKARRIDVLPAHPYLNGFWWVAAEDITMTEQWSREIADMRIGDTVRRTVHVVAKGTTAERLPELKHNTTPGLSVHDAGGSQTTRFTPDGAVAEVTRSWDITLNREDPVNIAPVSIHWWHTGEARPASSGVPSARIEPLAVNAAQLRQQLLAEAAAEHGVLMSILTGLLVLVLAPFVVLALAFLRAFLPSPADLRLRRCLRNGEPEPSTCEIVRWARRTLDPRIRTVGDVERIAPEAVAAALRRVQESAYGLCGPAPDEGRLLTRWSRRLRLSGLASSLVRMAEKVAG